MASAPYSVPTFTDQVLLRET